MPKVKAMQSSKDEPDQAKMGLIVLFFVATIDNNIENEYLLNLNNAIPVAVNLDVSLLLKLSMMESIGH